MAMTSVSLCLVLICAVYAANAQYVTAQQFHLQSLNRAVEAAKAMYETLAEEQARAQYYYFYHHHSIPQQQSDQQQGRLVTDQQALEAKEEFLAGVPTFPRPMDKAIYQGGESVTNQQALEAKHEPPG